MAIESHPIFGGSLAGQKGHDRVLLTSHDGSRAILYQDSVVRWCHVSDQNYKSMPLVPRLGEVEHPVLSKSGNFLCVYNHTEVRIIEIPWGYTEVTSIAKTFQSVAYKSGENEVKIKQVLFHPLAYQEETVVILKDDDSISIANWKDSEISKPDVLNRPNGTYSLDYLITDIESVSFSQDGLTLYALSSSECSDIYAFYPCLPPRIELSNSQVEILMQKSLIQYDSLAVETESDVKRNTIKQLQFVTKLHKSISEYKGRKDTKVFETSFQQRQVKGQGSFTVIPFPEKFYNCTGKMIAVVPVDENIELLAMAFDDGTFAILFKDLELTMNWDITGYNHDNSLALIELVTLNSKNITRLVVNPNVKGRFFAFCEEGVYEVDTAGWSKVLANCLKECDLRPLSELKFESSLSFIPFKGESKSLAFWSSAIEKSIVLVSNHEVIGKDLRQPTEEIEKLSQDIPSQKSSVAYEAKYAQPIEEIMALNRRFQRETSEPPSKIIMPQQRQAPLNNSSNELQLELLTEVSKDFLDKIANAQILGVALHNRLAEQEYDLTRQLKSSSELMQKQADILNHFKTQSSRWTENQSRQKDLLARFNKMKDNLVKISDSKKFRDMDINKQEIEWFKEIRNQVLTFNRYVHSQKKLQDQLSYLKKELDRIGSETANCGTKVRDDWEELRSMLEEDTRILKECNDQLKNASSQVLDQPRV